MENNNSGLNYDEEKINYLLDNIDKIPRILSKNEINLLIDNLRQNLDLIEKAIVELKKMDIDHKYNELFGTFYTGLKKIFYFAF